MQEMEQETPQRPLPPRVVLLRQWLTDHPIPATAFAIVAAILLLASGYFVYSAINENSRQNALEDQIKRLVGIAATSPQRLGEVTKEYERIQKAMPTSEMNETDVYRAVLDLAASGSMDVQISYLGDSQTKVGNTSYRAMSFTMNVSGPNDLVEELLKELDRPPERLATLVLGKVSVSVGVSTRISADFVVYTHVPTT